MQQVVFCQDGYTVIRREYNTPGNCCGNEWIISCDPVVTFSLGYEPELIIEGIKEEVRRYKLEKQDKESERKDDFK